MDWAKYVNAAALKTDLHWYIFSLGTNLLSIGKALLKLASNSTGRVIKWISTFVDKHPIIIIAAIRVINGLLVKANIDGSPIINKNEPILWKIIVFSINDCLRISGLYFSLSWIAWPISCATTAMLVILFLSSLSVGICIFFSLGI